LVPFLSYQYKIAPLIAESLVKRPWVIAKYLAVPYLAAEVTKSLHDLTKEDWDKLKKDLPTYIKNSGSYMVMPMKSPEDNWQWANLEYYFPWGNMLGLFRDIGEANFTEIRKDLGITNPFLSIFEMTGSAGLDSPPKDPFTKKEIYNQLDSYPEQAAKVVKWLAFQWLPNMLDYENGAIGYSYNAARQTQDRWGRTVTPAQAIGRWFGLNIVSTSPKQTAIIKKMKMRQLKSDLLRIFRDPRVSQEKKNASREIYKEKIKAVRRGED